MTYTHPTIWRTCRVLAHATRLTGLKVVVETPSCTVQEVAARLGIAENQASQVLRSLQSRGLVTAERRSRWVHYTAHPDPLVPSAQPVLSAMSEALVTQQLATTQIIRVMTAFTHPRRLVVLHHLQQNGPTSVKELAAGTRISPPALWRHLRKLARRGLVVRTNNRWRLASRPGDLAHALLSLLATDQESSHTS